MNEAVRQVRFERARRLLTRSGDGTVDTVLAAAVVAMIGFGVVMVYSSSSFEATVRFGDAQYFLKRQAIFAVMSLLAMWLLSRLDYRLLRPLTYPMLIVVIGLLVGTLPLDSKIPRRLGTAPPAPGSTE